MSAEADGTPFGRYRLIAVLGRGGMGEVWRAHDTDTDRTVAIKLLPANLSEDEDFKRRFRREAHAAARLNSPHVIPIHHYGEIDGRLYVDMRLIEGRDLQTLLADGPLEPARAVHIIGQVAEALHAAHEVGLLHRDIKPSNILLDRNDFAYLIDFGIARVLEETRMTKSGYMIGTFQYIAPERLDSSTEDARADIYSLACVLYECLTGHPPFDGDTMARLVAAHLSTPPPRPSVNHPDVPQEVDEVIATGMAKDPDERYATTVALADAARDAITVPIARPVANPTRVRETQPAPQRATAQPATVKAEPPARARPAPPTPTKTGGISRRTTLTLIGGGAVAAVAAAIGIPALTKNRPSQSSPTPSTSSEYSAAAQVELPFTGLRGPMGVAVDSTGAVYVADPFAGQVLKLTAGSSTPTSLPFTSVDPGIVPDDVAVGHDDSLYVTDGNSYRKLLKLAAGSSTPSVLLSDDDNTFGGVAVDGNGTLYVGRYTNHTNGTSRVVKVLAGSSIETALLTGLNSPDGVAVDGAGNLYVADSKRVLKLSAGTSTPIVLSLTGLDSPYGVAVDGVGNLYVTDVGTNRVLKLAPGASAPTVLPFTGLKRPYAVAVDSTGSVYIADSDNHRVLKLPAPGPRSVPAPLPGR